MDNALISLFAISFCSVSNCDYNGRLRVRFGGDVCKLTPFFGGLTDKKCLFGSDNCAFGCCSSCCFQNWSRIGRRSIGCRVLRDGVIQSAKSASLEPQMAPFDAAHLMLVSKLVSDHRLQVLRMPSFGRRRDLVRGLCCMIAWDDCSSLFSDVVYATIIIFGGRRRCYTDEQLSLPQFQYPLS